MSASNSWIARPHPNPQAKLRLFCLPYSGAGASVFYSWAGYLAPLAEVCAVEFPGHGRRLAEPLIDGMAPLVEELATGLQPHLGKPFAVLGHSMGALLGFELSRHLGRHSDIRPLHLYVSGHVAPQVSSSAEPIHNLPEPEFVQRIRELDGTPEEALESQELQELILPILRADFKVCETYTYEEDEPLNVPMTALGGLADKYVRRKDLQAWSHQTRGPFSLRMFPGGHFFIKTATRSVLDVVAHSLSDAANLLQDRE
jgi:medium-chain acyl-[acyl-carrier-protein] hydrolase